MLLLRVLKPVTNRETSRMLQAQSQNSVRIALPCQLLSEISSNVEMLTKCRVSPVTRHEDDQQEQLGRSMRMASESVADNELRHFNALARHAWTCSGGVTHPRTWVVKTLATGRCR
jgi:hypothetical protein